MGLEKVSGVENLVGAAIFITGSASIRGWLGFLLAPFAGAPFDWIWKKIKWIVQILGAMRFCMLRNCNSRLVSSSLASVSLLRCIYS